MDMPSSAKPPEEQKNEADTPTINLSADRITISENGKEGRELTMDQLRAELWKKNFPSRSEKDRAVVLETSDDVKYERYYQVATAIAAAGGVVAIMEN
jgi:biopolymer transport protein ExbD